LTNAWFGPSFPPNRRLHRGRKLANGRSCRAAGDPTLLLLTYCLPGPPFRRREPAVLRRQSGGRVAHVCVPPGVALQGKKELRTDVRPRISRSAAPPGFRVAAIFLVCFRQCHAGCGTASSRAPSAPRAPPSLLGARGMSSSRGSPLLAPGWSRRRSLLFFLTCHFLPFLFHPLPRPQSHPPPIPSGVVAFGGGGPRPMGCVRDVYLPHWHCFKTRLLAFWPLAYANPRFGINLARGAEPCSAHPERESVGRRGRCTRGPCSSPPRGLAEARLSPDIPHVYGLTGLPFENPHLFAVSLLAGRPL